MFYCWHFGTFRCFLHQNQHRLQNILYNVLYTRDTNQHLHRQKINQIVKFCFQKGLQMGNLFSGKGDKKWVVRMGRGKQGLSVSTWHGRVYTIGSLLLLNPDKTTNQQQKPLCRAHLRLCSFFKKKTDFK
jgi:hypothetical protein